MAADRSGEAVEMCKAKLDALNEEIDGIERALIEAKAANLPDAAAKVSLAAWRLAGAIVDDVRDLLSEVANNFGEGKISLGDLVTLRHVLELIERLSTSVAPVEFDILARGTKEAIVLLLRGALEYVGHLNSGSTTIRRYGHTPRGHRAAPRPASLPSVRNVEFLRSLVVRRNSRRRLRASAGLHNYSALANFGEVGK